MGGCQGIYYCLDVSIPSLVSKNPHLSNLIRPDQAVSMLVTGDLLGKGVHPRQKGILLNGEDVLRRPLLCLLQLPSTSKSDLQCVCVCGPGSSSRDPSADIV